MIVGAPCLAREREESSSVCPELLQSFPVVGQFEFCQFEAKDPLAGR